MAKKPVSKKARLKTKARRRSKTGGPAPPGVFVFRRGYWKVVPRGSSKIKGQKRGKRRAAE